MSAVPLPPPPPPPATKWHQRLLPVEGDLRRLADHERRHGALPPLAADTIVREVEDSGLLGRGGAGFPTGRKIRSVRAEGGRPVVVANGCEGEPASSKDVLLMERAPHLVLDGLLLAARAVGAREAHLVLHEGSPAGGVLQAALAERRRAHADGKHPARVSLSYVPQRYVASEETALVQFLNGGPAKPLFTPPRPYQKGVHRQPTLINNVETLAHLALIARHGAGWFRCVGDPDEPGTQLLTVRGPGRVHTVVEVPTGTTVQAVLRASGVETRDLQAVLLGGYFGSWLPDSAVRLPITHASLKAAGSALGAGIVVALPHGVCPVAETARVAAYLADHNAGQCGPCINGLPAIAGALERLAVGPWDERLAGAMNRWLAVVPGRGACRHPDGAVRFVTSALRVFAADVDRHRAGMPCRGARHGQPFLPVPRNNAASGLWR